MAGENPPSTGAGGNTGPPGAKQPTGHTSVYPAGTGADATYTTVPHAEWDKTKQGSSLKGGYDALHQAFTKTMPGIRQQYRNLAGRPIGG